MSIRLTEDFQSSRETKGATKKKILRIFKKAKAIRKLDVSGLLVLNTRFWFSTFLYIAKKANSVFDLKTHELRVMAAEEKDLVVSWPKYMKNLRSLFSEVIADFGWIDDYKEKRKPVNDYLKYLPKLENIEIKFFHNTLPFDLDGVWKFQTYPSSIKKIHFTEAKNGDKPINGSMAHLKNLKDLRFGFRIRNDNSMNTLKSVLNLLPQVPQLEALDIDFLDFFKIDASVCAALKSLFKLRKVKFSIWSENEGANLQKILKSLEDCPLEDVDLKVDLDSDRVVSLVRDFIEKKSGLKSLNLQLLKYHIFKSSKEIENLLKTIDDLPLLISFCFVAKTTLIYDIGPKNILPEIGFPFKKLFGSSRSTPLKKFRISMNQHNFGKSGFIKLLESMNEISPILEDLQIDLGKYEPQDINMILGFLNNLRNIRFLKLDSLGVSSKSFFFELIEAIENLKCLREFSLGEVSENVKRRSYFDGVERILLKNGLETFNCEVSEELKKILGDSFSLDSEEISMKNPFLKKGPGFKENQGFWSKI